jgi:hypothetical protein
LVVADGFTGVVVEGFGSLIGINGFDTTTEFVVTVFGAMSSFVDVCFDFACGMVFGAGAGIVAVVEILGCLVGIDDLCPIDIGKGSSRQSQGLKQRGQTVVVGVWCDGFDELSDGVVD